MGPPRVELVRADADFRAEAEFAAIREARRGVPVHRSRIDLIEITLRASRVSVMIESE